MPWQVYIVQVDLLSINSTDRSYLYVRTHLRTLVLFFLFIFIDVVLAAARFVEALDSYLCACVQ